MRQARRRASAVVRPKAARTEASAVCNLRGVKRQRRHGSHLGMQRLALNLSAMLNDAIGAQLGQVGVLKPIIQHGSDFLRGAAAAKEAAKMEPKDFVQDCHGFDRHKPDPGWGARHAINEGADDGRKRELVLLEGQQNLSIGNGIRRRMRLADSRAIQQQPGACFKFSLLTAIMAFTISSLALLLVVTFRMLRKVSRTTRGRSVCMSLLTTCC